MILPASLGIYLGVLGMLIGALAIVGGFMGGGFTSFGLGILSVILGFLLLSSPLMAAGWLPVVLGVLLLLDGLVLIIWAFRARNLTPTSDKAR